MKIEFPYGRKKLVYDFDENELALLDSSGKGLTLGKYIFRLENAAIAGAAYLLTIAHSLEKK